MKVFAPGSVVGGRFHVEREVGRGGVGIVYRAHDQATDKPVALKVIGLSGVDAKEETRFVQEGRVVAGIIHPNVVQVVAFGELDGTPFVAMEWLEGEDLLVRHKRMPLALEEILDVGIQMAEALEAAHAVGIVHRDVKPSNVLALKQRSGDGRLRVKLVDFGVALSGDSRSTSAFGIVGTPAYMAPEQARGEELIDARADLYALGATLFELTAGRPPHVGPTPVAILARLVTTPAPRLGEHAPDAPASLDDLMSSLLATSPDERPARASLVRDALKAIQREIADNHYSRARPNSSASEFPQSVDSLSLSPSQVWGSRLVTSIVATSVPKGEVRTRLLSHLRAHGAEAVELGGEALVAHLGVDRALGDEAARAADLALRLAQSGAAVGIATGRTKLTKSRTSGEVVDRAASLSRDAQKGRVLLDTTTSELARGRFELLARSDGTSELGNALQGKRDAGGGAPFVGREAELAQILDAFERCADDRVPVVATISGAPGLGKTRLGREVLSRFVSHASHPNIALVECESFAKGQTLGIMADVARGLCGLTKSATVIDALAAVQSLLKDEVDVGTHELVAKLVANQALIESRLSQGTRDVLWLSLTHIALAMARQAPLVLAIEDAQWADAESLAWVDHVLARSAGSSVFVLLSARPGLWRENPTRFAGRDHVKVELRPLARKNVRAIAKAILGAKADTPEGEDLTQSIAEQSGGSPLFAQELARLSSLGGNTDKRATPTIEAAIQVHLDALDAPARDAARKLSVYGTRCWDRALSSLGVPDAAARMKELASAEVLVEQASSRFRESREFIFKHALTRDVAYASLGDDELRELHAKAGQYLSTIGEDDATVARHLELGKSFTLAADYMDRAARRALATNSLQQAVEFAEKALAFAEDAKTTFARAQVLEEAWSRLDARAGERDTAVRAMRDSAYDEPTRIMAKGARLRYEDATGGTNTTTTELEDVCRQARHHKLYDEEVRCLAALAARLAFAGDTDQAEDRAKELLVLAREHRLSAAAVDAWQTLAIVMQARGNVGKALDARKNAVSAAREAGLKTREATLIINMGFALTTVGAKEEAKAAILDGISLAERVGSPGTVRHGQMNLLCWAATFGADADTDAYLAEPRALADSVATGSWVPHDRATLGVLFYRGLELLRRGDHERARNLLQSSALGYKATRMQDVMPVALGAWAEAERRCGGLEKALSLGQEASTLLDQGSPSLLNEASVFLSLHDTYVDLGRTDDAKSAIALGVPHLLTRLEGLAETSRSLDFLMKLAENKSFLSVADAYGLVPLSITALLGGRSTTLGPPPVHA